MLRIKPANFLADELKAPYKEVNAHAHWYTDKQAQENIIMGDCVNKNNLRWGESDLFR